MTKINMIKQRTLDLSDRFHLKKFFIQLFLYALLIGLCFVIIYPLISKFSAVFKSEYDLKDPIVNLIPRNPSFFNLKRVWENGHYLKSFTNTFFLSFFCALFQTASSTSVAYGLARYKFRGRGILYALVIFTIIVPFPTVSSALYIKFRYMDFFGILSAIGIPVGSSIDTPIPLLLLSLMSIGFKNGLFIFVILQSFKGLPKAIVEAANVDGANHLQTFYYIMMPQEKPIMTSVFMLSFAWQWTDISYVPLFLSGQDFLNNMSSRVTTSLGGLGSVQNALSSVLSDTSIFVSILPVLILYIICQKSIITGIEQCGITG